MNKLNSNVFKHLSRLFFQFSGNNYLIFSFGCLSFSKSDKHTQCARLLHACKQHTSHTLHVLCHQTPSDAVQWEMMQEAYPSIGYARIVPLRASESLARIVPLGRVCKRCAIGSMHNACRCTLARIMPKGGGPPQRSLKSGWSRSLIAAPFFDFMHTDFPPMEDDAKQESFLPNFSLDNSPFLWYTVYKIWSKN